jgi:DNA-binding transcriptional MerR regulator
MTIGQLARRSAPSAIRYYEAHGILNVPPRSSNEYRLVQRAKELGLSLEEIRQIIATSPRRIAVHDQSETPRAAPCTNRG